jgi:trimeric autotransporter adhesin
MKVHLGICAVAAICCPSAISAQENWAGTPVPPAVGSSGIVSGTEYLEANCNLRAPGNFRCADNPNAVRTVFIPLSAFARSSTVDALGDTVAGLQGQLAGIDTRLNSLEALVGSQSDVLESIVRDVASDRQAARRGIAAAIAIGSAPMPSAPGRTSYDFNLATFRGRQAVGGSLKHRLDTQKPLAVSFGFSAAGRRNNAARLGISGEF